MDTDKIKKQIIEFLKKGNPLVRKLKKIPLDQSLLQRGYIDSFAFIELISFLEKTFKISIEDQEINPENFGSINKMAKVVFIKLQKKAKKSK